MHISKKHAPNILRIQSLNSCCRAAAWNFPASSTLKVFYTNSVSTCIDVSSAPLIPSQLCEPADLFQIKLVFLPGSTETKYVVRYFHFHFHLNELWWRGDLSAFSPQKRKIVRCGQVEQHHTGQVLLQALYVYNR